MQKYRKIRRLWFKRLVKGRDKRAKKGFKKQLMLKKAVFFKSQSLDFRLKNSTSLIKNYEQIYRYLQNYC